MENIPDETIPYAIHSATHFVGGGNDVSGTWFPLLTSGQVPSGIITQAILHGQELALWRNANGEIQAWENRCPHRGTRFTMGRIVDDELSCAYHGWRFGSGGQCTAIPAHPGMTPPKSICAKTYAVAERYGMVWVALGPGAEAMPEIPVLADVGRRALYCRSFVTYASASSVLAYLQAAPQASFRAEQANVLIELGASDMMTVLLLLPMTANKSVVHLWLSGAVDGGQEQMRHRQIERFKRIRRKLEVALAS